MVKIVKAPNISEKHTDTINPYTGYDQYIAVDWSKTTMAIARISAKQPNHIRVVEEPSSLHALKTYLRKFEQKKILVLEESTQAHWLYVNIRDEVDRIVICDPYRNHLLKDGPKNDAIDARKLCRLLFNGLVKEVYHSSSKMYDIRPLVSAYLDLVKQGVRLQNQLSAVIAHQGLTKQQAGDAAKTHFVIKQLTMSIDLYETQKKAYVQSFEALCKKHSALKYLRTIPGIGDICAVKIATTVVDPKRFGDKGKYLAYCGLVSYQIESGGKIYGRRRPRYCRVLKEVYKTAASVVINGGGPLRRYYDALIARGLSEHNARHALARRIAVISFGILKHPKAFIPKKDIAAPVKALRQTTVLPTFEVGRTVICESDCQSQLQNGAL
jgi:transposase